MKKVLTAISLVALLGGCALKSDEARKSSLEVHFFTYPVYPTRLNPEEEKCMHQAEILYNQSIYEESATNHLKGNEYIKPAVNILTVRF